MSKQTILIVEDEEDIRELLVYNLKKEGFATLDAGDGGKALGIARAKLPDLILLDIMLPGMDGLEVCRELERVPATSGIPIIMLTARGEEIDRILGLEMGADDYMVKPFSVRELVLRIRKILKRQSRATEGEGLSRHGISIDQGAHKVTLGGATIEVTATEFRLLEDLMRHAGQLRTREQLLDSIWGYQFDGYARTVDSHMRRLRAKLGASGELLETVRGFGYRFKE